MADKTKAKQLLDAGDLRGAGEELGIRPVCLEDGHAFNESKESYARRLLAECVGAHAAGAVVREEEPMQGDDEGYPQDNPDDVKTTGDQNAPEQAPTGTDDGKAADDPALAPPPPPNSDQGEVGGDDKSGDQNDNPVGESDKPQGEQGSTGEQLP